MIDYVHQLGIAQTYLRDCDHYDCKVIEGQATLREFLAGMLSYYPAWIRSLYAMRWGFVRLLGMKQEGVPDAPRLQPADISFQVGEKATIFTVEQAKEEQFWMAGASESHLSAYLLVVVEPLDEENRRFHVATIVHYNNWTDPVYFNAICPFHHLVVKAMMQAGVDSHISTGGLHYA